MPVAGSRKFAEQRFRFLEVVRVEAFGEAKQLVDASTGLSNFPFPQLAIDTALAAIPARYALDRGQWWGPELAEAKTYLAQN